MSNSNEKLIDSSTPFTNVFGKEIYFELSYNERYDEFRIYRFENMQMDSVIFEGNELDANQSFEAILSTI